MFWQAKLMHAIHFKLLITADRISLKDTPKNLTERSVFLNTKILSKGYCMSCRIEFFSETHISLRSGMARDLFKLREKTFNSRLEWQVECENGLEKDFFDNKNAIYLLGVSKGHLVCGARFIDMRHENMITTVFSDFFGGLSLREDIPCYDVSRLFIDKERRKMTGLVDKPVSRALFIAMIKLCQETQHQGMYAVISRGMYMIFRLSGWRIQVLNQGTSEKNEPVYFIYMPATQNALDCIQKKEPENTFMDAVAYRFEKFKIIPGTKANQIPGRV
jgi:N-acyl-L-homoserine lactone synthetase